MICLLQVIGFIMLLLAQSNSLILVCRNTLYQAILTGIVPTGSQPPTKIFANILHISAGNVLLQ